LLGRPISESAFFSFAEALEAILGRLFGSPYPDNPLPTPPPCLGKRSYILRRILIFTWQNYPDNSVPNSPVRASGLGMRALVILSLRKLWKNLRGRTFGSIPIQIIQPLGLEQMIHLHIIMLASC
jgi:hypothetical protein